MPLLFSYGTLQQTEVQLATFGRLLVGTADELLGFSLAMLKIDDAEVVRLSGKTHHPILKHTGKDAERVAGTVFEISEDELIRANTYEVSDYKRVAALLASGRTAWVYVEAKRDEK
jgi:gamma-glutamylcyclotransferase (GGCT)/AIG2-like uncharacterized protein YtfP